MSLSRLDILLPTCSTVSPEHFVRGAIPRDLTSPSALNLGFSLLIKIYSIGTQIIRDHALDIGMSWVSAHAFDKMSKKNAKLLFHGSKQSEKIIKQFKGKFEEESLDRVSDLLPYEEVASLDELASDVRKANISFKDKRLIGNILHQTNQMIQLELERNTILRNQKNGPDLKEQAKLKSIDLNLKKYRETLPWQVAKLGFTVLVESKCEEGTAKLLKELGKFIFWGKGKPLKNFEAFRESLEKSGAIAPLKEGDLGTAIESLDEKTLSSANKLGIDIMTYLTAGLNSANMLGADMAEPISESANNLLFSWKLFNLLWDPKIAETPNEERSWFVRLFTGHYHSARNERANKLLTRNFNPYR